MQRAAVPDVDVNRELALLMQYNPPFLVLDSKRTRRCPPLKPSLTFYDKHLDVKLMFKKSVVIPLETYVSETVNHTAQIYQETTGFYSSVVASTLLFHFRGPGWFTALLCYALQVHALDTLSMGKYTSDFFYPLYKTPSTVWRNSARRRRHINREIAKNRRLPCPYRPGSGSDEAGKRHRNQEIVKQEHHSCGFAASARTYTALMNISQLILTSRIAGVAIDVAHKAHLKCVDSDGRTRHLNEDVVKLSFGLEQTKGPRHEISIYEHLAIHGIVKGIPLVYGLFDVETDTMALVMSHVGTEPVTLLSDTRRYGVTISESTSVLGKIHKAGVRHRDIRPENLCCAKRREMRHITDMLTGSYLPPATCRNPSEATKPEKQTASTSAISTALDSVDEEEELE
ncbi:hypothetical protein FPV67DRAFT_1446170 [Lyophyllum atratum]|nr:hypothetical protein FPV67DRAFT_1446170 [Lyophyllum atratum]